MYKRGAPVFDSETEENLQSFFIVLPAIQIWTDEEHVHESAIHYPNYEMALANAKVFSRRYDCEFYILEAKSIVKTTTVITSID